MRRLVLSLVLAFGCGPIDPEPLVDENGEEVVVVGPFDQLLNVVSVKPNSEDINPSSDLLITFDRYLSDDEFVDFSAMTLVSGGLRVNGRTSIMMTDRSIRFRPLSPMTEGLRYLIALDPNQLVSETNAPLGDNSLPVFTARAFEPLVTFDRTEPTWTDVKRIFARKCDVCHSDPQWQLVPLEHRDLLGEKSDQVNRFLVRAFDPTDSYLMHKILPGYADRRYTIQPPPWSEGIALTREERVTIEFWILAGAKLEE